MSDSSGDLPQFPSQPPPFPAAPPPPPPNMAPPPGYVSYNAANQGAYSSFQRVGGVARALGILVTILIPVILLQIVLIMRAKSFATDFINGKIDVDHFNRGIAPYGLTAILTGVLQLAILILTMIWMFRMAKNQRTLGRQGTWGPPWAIASWFLPPCVLYVLPYLMFRDLWKSSEPNSNIDWRRNPVAPIVHIWWILFGLVPIAFVTVTFGRFRVNTDDSDHQKAVDFSNGINLNVAASIVAAGAALAFLFLIRQLTARHKQTINEV